MSQAAEMVPRIQDIVKEKWPRIGKLPFDDIVDELVDEGIIVPDSLIILAMKRMGFDLANDNTFGPEGPLW
jgi:hypothetical protein